MLIHLQIRDFALIDALELDLGPGLTVLTGETGAGKSILFDALGLVLGQRANPADVRPNAKSAYVEAVLDPPVVGRENTLLEEYDIDAEDSIVLSREILSSGRSVARVNGRGVSVRTLAHLGRVLVDVHGQSDHQSLFHRSRQLEYLDKFAGLLPQRKAVSVLTRELLTARRRLDELQHDTQSVQREAGLLTFQVEEIAAADLRPGEDHELRAEQRILMNAELIQSLATRTVARLHGESPDVVADIFGETQQALGKLADLDSALQPFAQQADELKELANDLALTLQSYAENVEADPDRLQQVEERLNLIEGLVRKYAAFGSNTTEGTVEAVIAHGKAAEMQLETFTNSDTRLKALQDLQAKLTSDLVHAARGLSAERRRAAHTMAGAVAAQLDDLNLLSAGFEIHFEHRSHPDGLHIDSESEPIAFDESGIDVAEFLISPNIGQPLRPLAEIASEGERSRVLLALKVVLAKVDETPTLIFDEIDMGVGSRTGSLVGQKLSALSSAHQVLCVTHLAPVAAFADTHFVVAKSSVGDTSLVRVGPVKGRQAIEELAAMSGASTTAGQRVARDLVSAANGWKDSHSSS